ncbi:hypothetical protein [Longimicrobium sp.]|uniref:hypothetical protein n=1 Tax=Longimicrobium sp. TaxID=2029185 RepID=UPI002C9D2779|nr:hypothetical protein [Longimicrobium sp.]HSU16416.1 hypothetical protein [Longimicrobium sp.]
MKRSVWVAALLAAGACGGGDNVVVRASLDGQPVGDLPVRLLPYDRQAVLDSIATESGTPEPKIPGASVQRLRTLQAEEAAVKARGDTATGRIEAERRALLAQIDSIRRARDRWLHDVDKDFQEAVKGSGDEHADTTDTSGRASFGVDAGKWWAVSRYVLPDAVLEWQVPVTARKGDSTVVRLTRRNAHVEPPPP